MSVPRCQAQNPASCTSVRCPDRRAFADDFASGFRKRAAVAVPVAKNAADVLLKKALDVVARHGRQIAFISRGNDTYGAEFTLADMADADKARGNCWAASSAFLYQTETTVFAGHVMHRIELDGTSGYHAATAVQDGERYYVVDYTIRQFDASLPFPYVGSQAAWVDTIERATGGNPLYDDVQQELDEGDMDGWEPVSVRSAIRLGG